MSNTTIILTTTINITKRVDCIYQINSDERLNTYLPSIRNWLEKTKFNIVVVENSGYTYEELNNEKEIYKDRFEVISFKEKEEPEATNLLNNPSKGASEVFAIYYAFFHSKILPKSTFIIKVTGRYFIGELESYLSNYDLNKISCLTQFDRNRCEMVGSHIKYAPYIFNTNLIDETGKYNGHIEHVWKIRTSKFKNILVCKKFNIQKTQRGGVNQSFTDI